MHLEQKFKFQVKTLTTAREVAQEVKGLPCKSASLSSSLRIHIKAKEGNLLLKVAPWSLHMASQESTHTSPRKVIIILNTSNLPAKSQALGSSSTAALQSWKREGRERKTNLGYSWFKRRWGEGPTL